MQDPSQTIAVASSGSSLPLVLQPARTFQTGPFSIQHPNMAASPDGKAVFLVTTEPSVNVWKTLVYYSPEVFVALGCIAALLVGRRVARRPQIVGEKYCRRCNYLLKNHVSDVCTECGQPLTARSMMRGARRNVRVALLGAIVIAYVILYFSDALSPLRTSNAGSWLDWRSRGLVEPLQPIQGGWAGRETMWMAVRVDLASGAATSIELDARERVHALAIAADGRSLAAWSDGGVYRHEWPSGKRTASMRIRETSLRKRWLNNIVDAELTPDLNTAFLVTMDGEVERWDLNTGTTLRLYTPEKSFDPSRSRPALTLPRDDGGRLIMSDAYVPERLLALSRDGQAEPQRLDMTQPDSPTSAAPDLDVLVIPRQDSQANLDIKRLADGTHQTLKGAASMISGHQVSILPTQRWVIAESYGPTRDLFVWDVTTGECAFQLAASNNMPIAWVMVNDRTIARLFANGPMAASPFRIDVFELPDDDLR